MGVGKPHISIRTFKLETVSVIGRTGTVAGQSCPAIKKHRTCANLKTSSIRTPTYTLPKGLVGSKCTALVKIAGSDCNCILDSGSQVTTVSETFYKQNFLDQDIFMIS